MSVMIDYVGLMWKNDEQYFQNEVLPFLALMKKMAENEGGKAGNYRVTVKRAKMSDVALFMVDSWGRVADCIAQFMEWGWWPRVTRLDYREELADFDRQDISTLAGAMKRVGAAQANLNTFDKQDAQKNNKRGAGGVGFEVGSRFSPRCMTVYARRRERPAYEMQVRKDVVRWVGNQVFQRNQVGVGAGCYATACALLRDIRKQFIFDKWGVTDVIAFWQEQIENERDVQDLVAEVAIGRAAQRSQQMDFWSALAENLPGETGAFTVAGE